MDPAEKQSIDAAEDERNPPQNTSGPAAIDLLGVGIHVLTEEQCIGYMLDELDAGRGGWVHTVNLDILKRRVCDRSFAQLCAPTRLVVADGMPLVWASRIQRTPLPERVAGSHLVASLSARAAERGRSLFLLGGNPGTAEEAAQILQERSPALEIAGLVCPEVGFESDDKYIQHLENQLKVAAPDIIYVALGVPKQEDLIARLRHVLPQAWWMGVGISFSYLSGDVPQAPKWMQRVGLEWGYRLWQEPGRLARRYLVDDVPFALRMMANAGVKRFFKRVGKQN